MSFTIRPETSADYPVIYDLIKTAFATAKVSDGSEQDFAVKLRESKNYLPELALVACQRDKLIGHIMLTKAAVNLANGSELEGLLLAPIAVLKEYRNQAVGSTLIKSSFELAKALGYKVVFLCGDPAYYTRFGFKLMSQFGIESLNIPAPYAMAYELEADALKDTQGTFLFAT